MSDNRYDYCLYLYRFLKGSAAEEACAAVASAVGSNPLLMTELDLSKLIPEALGVTQLCALLEDSHCRLQRLRLVDVIFIYIRSQIDLTKLSLLHQILL